MSELNICFIDIFLLTFAGEVTNQSEPNDLRNSSVIGKKRHEQAESDRRRAELMFEVLNRSDAKERG